MPFDPEYVSRVLRENFEDAKTLFLSPLVAIHYAHLVMLRRQQIIGAADARALRAALDSISLPDVKATPFDHACEDLFFFVERLLLRACGEDVAGRLRVARSRNDIDMTMYRMRQREFVAALAAEALDLREALVDVAARNRETVFAAHTHTQPAQPTTIAHYLLAIVEQLERDHVRLQAAYASTNKSPLGACAITGTGFPIDRQLTSDLLGFDEPTGNTYGSIATVDYLLESVSAAQVLLAGLGRVVQDLLLWCTREFGYLRLADGLVQGSSIMPQKRNPVALEHARSITSKALGQAAAIVTTVHNTPFGDIVDTEDDLQPLVASMFRDAQRAVALVAASIRGAEFDVERLRAHAEEGGTTSTELADRLVRDHDVPFSKAHALVAAYLSGEVKDAVRKYTPEELATITSARHFVEVRSAPGGPAPTETARALAASRERLDRDRVWLNAARQRLDEADAKRQQLAQEL
ncbi:MAG TPA: argininosuccinate lyase [Vicinamibacterales bacterium]|jgi:argininosuccinate lyase